MRRLVSFGIACFLFGSAAQARDLCDYYEDFHPEMFRHYCQGDLGAGRLPSLGGALASFSDAFNLNPASIPTHPTPLGVEVIMTPRATTYGGTNYNFAIIHGFQQFGTALSTNSDNTFYSNKTWESPTSYATTGALPGVTDLATPTLNAGASLSLFDTPDAFINPKIGASIRYNRVSNSLGLGGGIGLVSQYFSLGVAVNRDSSNASSGQVTFYNFMAGLRLGFLQADYDVVLNTDPTYSTAVGIFTLTATLGSFLLTAAERSFSDTYGYSFSQYHAALQWRVSDRISLGYLLNYIPGSSSLGLQALLF